jgi:GPH family glycoside/pentoside/hexuronide:cation symporter
MASYGFGSMNREFLLMAFNTFVFFFYETEVGLNVWYIGIGLTIFSIYNAIDDPLFGYLTNKPFKFTKKWGRRFPWILLGGIPLGLCYFLLFSPPRVDPQKEPWILFIWLLFATCLFDTFHTIFFVNFQSLFPDKFRSSSERRTATGIQISLGVVGVALGSIIPPLLITFGNLESYLVQGFVVILFALVTMIIAIPGCREDKETVDRYLKSQEEVTKRTSFFKETILAFKQKSFVAFVILYLMYQALEPSMTASIPYVVRYVLNMQASATTLIMAAMLIGTIISIPLWVKLAHKTNDNGKVMLISTFLMAIFTAPLIFLGSYVPIIINMLIWGVSLGGVWTMIFPVMSDIIDESVVLHKRRSEGIYTGIQQFFGRLGLIIQSFSFAIAHTLTGFVEGAATQTPFAIWGIHVHLALVPMICMLFGGLVFWILYDLTPEKVIENQLQIKELKL